MLNILSKFFDTNEREINKLWPVVEQINLLEDKARKLKDKDFPKKTAEFRKRIADGENLFLLLPEAFALAREASRRVNNQRLYDVQLLASTVLAQGKIAEQKTGEGKTLSAVPALYLHSLSGKTVHLVTVNDYLARRDAGWMGAVFHLLGVSVSSIISEKSFIFNPDFIDPDAKDYRLVHLEGTTRKKAYEANVVYGINSEFGFDYLRDNMVYRENDLVQSGHYFAIIDEVDSVLIDEARTPHIISMPDATPSQKYYEYARIVDKLNNETDYKIDEKLRTAHLTDHGIAKVEKLYGVSDIYEKDFDTVYHIEAALKANTLFHKDREYIVRDNQVILVDEFTGRLLEGRRLSEGLHQAIEAKEGVAIQQESKTLATVSLQNYFRMYEKLAGMTGTALTEAEEFHKIYKLDVVVVPTNRPMVRADESDEIYKTTRAKIAAVVKYVEEAHKKGQPVLVGTTAIDKNDIISEYLKRKGIKHEVLNAKNHEREALIIKDAGKKGAVTVATNMAGRGVDIVLGGQPPSSFEMHNEEGEKQFKKELSMWQKEHNAVLKSGGLLVIGTEKHESRRIDNQLRGRSGRQGDPGRSIFIISLEDDLMRIFGGDSISNIMTRFNFPEDTPLTHGLVSRVIEQAQVKVEGFNFESRKHLLEYDDVLNKQRQIIYDMRKETIADDVDHIGLVMEKIEQSLRRIVTANLDIMGDGGGKRTIIDEFTTIVPFDDHSKEHLLKQIEQMQEGDEIVTFLTGIAKQIQEKREEQFGKESMNQIFKSISVSTIDNSWMDHLTAIEDLRTGIGLRGYGQRDPLVEYKNEAYAMFERLVAAIDDGIVTRVFKITITPATPQIDDKQIVLNQPAEEIGIDAAVSKKKSARKNNVQAPSLQSQVSGEINTLESPKKLGRNDPCWCGSGKKWKKCHYPQQSQV